MYPTTAKSGPIFWSGRRRTHRTKTAFYVYVGKLTWSHGRARVLAGIPALDQVVVDFNDDDRFRAAAGRCGG